MKNWKSTTAAIALLGLVFYGANLGTTYQLAAGRPEPVAVAHVEPIPNPNWQPLPAPVKTIKAPAPVPIPATIPVGQIVQLGFSDLTADAARKSHLDYYPRPAGAIWFPAVGLNGDVVVFFSSPVATKLLVWIDSPTADGGVSHAETEITVGTPTPPKPPEPPEPPQPPTPVVQKIQCVVVEQTEDSTAAFSQVRNSKAIRDWANAGGHRIYFIDKDSAKAAGGTWKTWADRAEGKTLPYCFIAPYAGGEPLKECEAPLGVTPFLTLLQKYGGVGTVAPIPSPCPNGTCPLTR